MSRNTFTAIIDTSTNRHCRIV